MVPTWLRDRFGTWRTSPRSSVIRLLPRVSRSLTSGLGIVVVAAGFLPVIMLFATGFLAESALETVRAGLGSAAGHRAIIAIAVICLAFVGTEVSGRLVSALSTSLGNRVDACLAQQVIQAVNGPVGIRHLDEPDTRDAIAQVAGMGVGSYTPGGAVAGLANRAVQTLQSLAAAAVLAAYRWWLAVAIVAVQFIWARQRRREYTQRAQVMARKTSLIRRSDYFRDLALTPAPAKEVQLFGLGRWLIDNFRAEWFSAMRKVRQERRARRLWLVSSLVAAAGLNMIAYIMLGIDALHGAIGLGLLVVYLRAVVTIASVATNRPQDLQIEHGMAAIPALLRLQEQTASSGLWDAGSGGPAAEPGAPHTELLFRGVSFSYPGAMAPALDGLDLAVPAGSSMAIVGLNGAGKTTLVKLLCRMYEPDTGAITVDGTSLAAFDPRGWRRMIAAIFQDFIHYELTVRENIAFGAPERAGDFAALERSASRAGILDRINALPAGWETPLARHLKGGAELSGGEWQRVALARALFAVEAGAQILVMDEPTASLDVRAEAEFYDQFLELTRGLTTVVISHRFSTVRQADRICVLTRGRVSELGNHEELVARGGQYAKMFTLASARFAGEAAG